MSTHEQYETTIYSYGPLRQMVVIANVSLNSNAVTAYINQYKPFLKAGGTIHTTGTIEIGGEPMKLGISKDKTLSRFAFSWTE